MRNTKHLLKVTVYWTSIVYTVCYLGVLLFPGIRPAFMLFGLHTALDIGEDVMTVTTYVSGLVIWNIVAILSVWLFAYLYNRDSASTV